MLWGAQGGQDSRPAQHADLEERKMKTRPGDREAEGSEGTRVKGNGERERTQMEEAEDAKNNAAAAATQRGEAESAKNNAAAAAN